MDMRRLGETELLKKSLENMKADRDKWKSACVDIVIYSQYGFGKVGKERVGEIFGLCHKATNAHSDEIL
jgi:hypothetical protein